MANYEEREIEGIATATMYENEVELFGHQYYGDHLIDIPYNRLDEVIATLTEIRDSHNAQN